MTNDLCFASLSKFCVQEVYEMGEFKLTKMSLLQNCDENVNVEASIVKFVSDIKSGKLEGSNKIATATVLLLEQFINDSQKSRNVSSALKLCEEISEVGRVICRALPQELVAANMVRRVLRNIRDECRAHDKQSSNDGSLQQLVLAAPLHRTSSSSSDHDLHESLKDHISELHAELESTTMSICSTALEHVHVNELILTYGASSLAEKFLKTCLVRRYRLILAEGPETKKSHAMARRLSMAGISVTVISNASIYGVMSRVNKVVIGVRSVLAGGAVLARTGMRAVTTAAKHYSVPVIALAPLYKLSPLHACDHHFNSLSAPHEALPYESLESSVAHVYSPMYDLAPPDHITLFITNIGGTSPSYIYRLLSELYDQKDHQL